MTSKVWNKDTINALLLQNEKAVARALIVLHNRQTPTEQAMKATTEHNGRGFSGLDGEFMSSLAERVKKGWGLTPKQLDCVRKKDKKGYCRLAKYHAQLVEEIDARSAQAH